MADLKGCGRKIGSYKVICGEFVAWADGEAARIERGEAQRYHAVLCDPPYGLEFMGKEWDAPHKKIWRGGNEYPAGENKFGHVKAPAYESGEAYQQWTIEWATALIPLLYPGALVFCFGGTRTWHRLACGFEDAGFQIWDTINYCSTEDPDYRCGWFEWYHGSGFPKAQEIGRFFCQCNEKNSKGNRELLDMRATNTETAECKKEKQGLLLQQGLCAKSPSCADDATNGRDRCDGVPRMDRSGQGDLAQEDDWQSKPGVEGRGNVLPQAWELQADQACPLPAELSADGTEGRLCNGAPTDSGAANGSPAPTQGNRTSCESRSAGQRADESRTLARQPDPQTMGARCPRCGKTIVSSAFRESLKGFKTAALKPSHEPVLCFKAPTQGKTYAELAMEYGSGALNVDGGRIAGPMDGVWGTSNEGCAPAFNASPEQHDFRSAPHNAGRYPANLALECTCETVEEVDARGGHWSYKQAKDGGLYKLGLKDLPDGGNEGGKVIRHTNPDCPCFQLDAQAGECKTGDWHGQETGHFNEHCGPQGKRDRPFFWVGDSGGPSRFFYCAKASRGEREAGLRGVLPCVGFLDEACTIRCSGIDTETHINWKGQVVKCHRNDHPTVKPVEHCRWLGTLLLPPESIKPRRLLVPFAGTGSEMVGALQSGWDEVVGIEQDVHYCEIARARIAHAEAQPNLFEPKLEQLEFVGASGN